MSTLTQLITETSALLGDSGGNRWRTAVANPPVLGTNDVQYILNKMAEEFALLTGVYRAAMPVQVAAKVPTVALLDAQGKPPFGPLLRLEDENGHALLQTSADWLNVTAGEDWKNLAPGGVKRYIRGLDGFGTVRLYPPPAKNATFTAYCVAEPVPMLAGNDLPWIGGGPNRQDSPVQYHAALPFGAAWFALLFNDPSQDIPGAAALKAEFDKRVQLAAAEVKAALIGG